MTMTKKQIPKHAMAETSGKSGPEKSQQSMKTSNENDQETSSHVCKICVKSFCSKRNLKSHIGNIHEGIKNFVCDVCGFF